MIRFSLRSCYLFFNLIRKFSNFIFNLEFPYSLFEFHVCASMCACAYEGWYARMCVCVCVYAPLPDLSKFVGLCVCVRMRVGVFSLWICCLDGRKS